MNTLAERDTDVTAPEYSGPTSVAITAADRAVLTNSHPLIDAAWADVLATIPVDLEQTAQTTQALQRRREVKTAADLLRLVLAYSVCDWSLRLVGLWACVLDLARLSDVAVLKRLQKAQPWLAVLLQALLQARRQQLHAAHPVRVRIVDGSAISGPGSQGTDYRVHLSLDLGAQRIDGVAITDVSGGETLARHPSRPGDIWVADRGYAHRPGVGTILQNEQGDVVLRIGWATFPLEQLDGTPFDLFPWLRQLAAEPGAQPVQVTTPEGTFRLRLIAVRLPPAAANRARRRIRQQAKKKGRMPQKRTLEAAGYLIVVTSLGAELWTPLAVLQLYRLRWQVELIFKRLKSLLHLDDLRAKGPALAQTYLLGKILAALIIEALTDQAVQRYPELFADTHRPISAWRWLMCGRDFVFTAVRGPISWQRLLDRLPHLKRYLCISSRQRPNQAVAARDLLSRLLGPYAIGPPALS